MQYATVYILLCLLLVAAWMGSCSPHTTLDASSPDTLARLPSKKGQGKGAVCANTIGAATCDDGLACYVAPPGMEVLGAQTCQADPSCAPGTTPGICVPFCDGSGMHECATGEVCTPI